MSEPAPQSIVAVLRSDHRAIGEQLDELLTDPAPEEDSAAREELVMTLVRHFVAEEQYLYPTMRDVLDDGTVLADAGLAEDRDCELLLKRLEAHGITGEQVVRTLEEVRTAFTEHVLRQERELEALDVACSEEQLTRLGSEAIGAEQVAPTRPRGFAPESPAANKVLSFVEGFLDQVRDHYSRRGVPDD